MHISSEIKPTFESFSPKNWPLSSIIIGHAKFIWGFRQKFNEGFPDQSKSTVKITFGDSKVVGQRKFKIQSSDQKPWIDSPLKFGSIQTSKICQIAWFYNMSFWLNYYLREIQLTQVYLQWIILISR